MLVVVEEMNVDEMLLIFELKASLVVKSVVVLIIVLDANELSEVIPVDDITIVEEIGVVEASRDTDVDDRAVDENDDSIVVDSISNVVD